ncbi:hypothetical protein [Micromonospora sp. LOL_023]|uniref:hypothetical protein n=1 Tax=Micromonospora sp. LOL_023 TaxID=3345418 RepID=UPI003A8AB3DE
MRAEEPTSSTEPATSIEQPSGSESEPAGRGGRVRLGTGSDQYYDRLVRVAYLVMADATEPSGGAARRAGDDRIAQAHRTVRRSLPWRRPDEAAYLWLLARVVRRAANPPRFVLSLPGRWGRPVPDGAAPQRDRLLATLATLPAPVRIGYVLVVVERLPPREAIQVLHEAGWPDPVLQVAAGVAEQHRLADAESISPARQRELLTGPITDPMTVRLRPPDYRTLRLVKLGRVAAVAACVAATVAVTAVLAPRMTGVPPEPSDPAGVPDTVGIRRIGDRAWLGAARPTLASWPTRGNRVDDTGLVDAALGSWLAVAELTGRDPAARAAAYGQPRTGNPDSTPGGGVAVPTRAGLVTAYAGRGIALAAPVGAAQLLYAGELTGAGSDPPAEVAVLADATRVAVYASSGGTRSLRIEAAPAANPYAASAIRVTWSAGPARYLMAPWIRRVDQRALAGGQWRELVVRDGLTDPVSQADTDPTPGCWSGPLLRAHPTDVPAGVPFTLADLGPAVLSRLTYLPPVADPGDVPADADDAGAARVWSGLGCLTGELAGHAPESILAWEVWSGTLPGGDGEVRVTCLRAELARDASLVAVALLVPGHPARAVATAADTRLCSPLAPAVALGWWWESPTGDWYHVAVGGGPVAELEVTIEGRRTRGTGMLVSPGYPDGPRGPVQLRATDGAGRSVPVLD